MGQIVIIFRDGAVYNLTYFDAEGEADAFVRGVRTTDDEATAYVLPRDMADLRKRESSQSNAMIDWMLTLTLKAIARAQVDVRTALMANRSDSANALVSLDAQAIALLKFVID